MWQILLFCHNPTCTCMNRSLVALAYTQELAPMGECHALNTFYCLNVFHLTSIPLLVEQGPTRYRSLTVSNTKNVDHCVIVWQRCRETGAFWWRNGVRVKGQSQPVDPINQDESAAVVCVYATCYCSFQKVHKAQWPSVPALQFSLLIQPSNLVCSGSNSNNTLESKILTYFSRSWKSRRAVKD